MAKELVRFWSEQLWRHYVTEITAGGPIYFAMDRQLLFELSKEAKPEIKSPEEAMESFDAACQELLDVSEFRVRIKDSAFAPVWGKKSAVICLAIQQVLVVENMLNDEEYSESSYFPRYRAVFGMELDRYGHQNPLMGDDFPRIWRKLEDEIKEEAGDAFKSEMITFAPGFGPSRNKNYPLSQALLTSHDLTALFHRFDFEKAEISEAAALQLLVRSLSALTRRGRELVLRSDEAMRGRITAQVRAFLRNPARILSLKRTKETGGEKKRGVTASWDYDDWGSDRLIVYTGDSFEDRDFGEGLLPLLKSRLGSNTALVLFYEDGEYEEVSGVRILDKGDAVVLIISSNSRSWLESTLIKAFDDTGKAEFVECASSLPVGYQVFVCGALPEGSGILASSSGILKALAGVAPTLRAISFEGGVLMDARQSVYLAGYPPNKILLEEEAIPLYENLTVNGSETTVGEFLERLIYDLENVYELIYQGRMTRLIIASKDAMREKQRSFGFIFEPSGILLPSCVERLASQPGISGFSVDECEIQTGELNERLGRLISGLLLKDMKEPGLPASEQEIQKVLELIAQAAPGPVAALLERRIRETRRLPVTVKVMVCKDSASAGTL